MIVSTLRHLLHRWGLHLQPLQVGRDRPGGTATPAPRVQRASVAGVMPTKRAASAHR